MYVSGVSRLSKEGISPLQPGCYRQIPVINSATVRPIVIPANTANTVNTASFN
jgi:hypothetical protein